MAKGKPQLDPVAVGIKRELERRDMTPYALAKAAGIAQPVLHRWLTGERSVRFDTMLTALDALDLELIVRRRKS